MQVQALEAPWVEPAPVAPVCSPTRVESRTRLAMLDAMRLVAAIGVIWMHTPESSALQPFSGLGRMGVPFFTFTMVLFAMEAGRTRLTQGIPSYFANRVARLFVPFLLWTGIYLALRNLKAAFIVHHAPVVPTLGMFCSGSVNHLWFLPYAVVMVTVAFALGRALSRAPTSVRLVVAAASVAIGVIILMLPLPHWKSLGFDMAYFLRQSQNKSPCAFWAIAVAIVFPMVPRRIWSSGAVAVGAALVYIVAGIVLVTVLPLNVVAHLGGLGLFVLGQMHFQATPSLQSAAVLGRYSFGVYLIHVALIEGIQAFTAAAGAPMSASRDLSIYAAAVILSLLLVHGVSRYRWGRFLMATA